MSDREKLIELINEGRRMCEDSDCENCTHNEDIFCTRSIIADHLISNGVTVGVDTKPLKQYLTQIDEYAGLKLKFLVFKADTGERIENCFVLRPDKDYAAVEALRAYAEATDNKTLADDIYNWVGNGVTVQKWIPVSERLPDLIPCNAGTAYSEAVNVLTSGRKVLTAIWDGTDFIADAEFWEAEGEEITHWTPVLLPLPEPPKECE